MRSSVRALLVGFCAVAFCLGSPAAPAAALTIDNFEQGDFNVVDTPTPGGATFGEQSGLSAANVAGSVRLVRVRTTAPVSSATASLTTTAADDGAVLTANAATAEFEFVYDGIANNNPDGRFGALNIDLSGFTSIDVLISAVGVSATAELAIWSSALSYNSLPVPIVDGVNSFALSEAAFLDLSDIQAIRLSITGLGTGEVPIVRDISAVPEPSAGLLAALGLAALASRRRISRG